MPGEDELIRGQQNLAAGLKDIMKVFNNFITTTEVRVDKGDTLWKLAEKHLGNGQRWREIFFINLDKIFKKQEIHHGLVGTPDLIYEGDTMRILSF